MKLAMLRASRCAMSSRAVESLASVKARKAGAILVRWSDNEDQGSGGSKSAAAFVVAVSFCFVAVSMMSKSSRTPGICHTLSHMSRVITLYASLSSLR